MRKKLVDALKWLWIIAVLAGAGWYFYRHYQEISAYLGTLSIPRITLCFLLLLAGKLLLSDVARLSLKKTDWKMPYPEALAITSFTQLGKYLPGGIWHFAGKFALYKVKGISTGQTTRAMIYENLWLLSSATVIGILMLLLSSDAVACEYVSFLCGGDLIKILTVGLPVLWIAGMFLFEVVFFRGRKVRAVDFLLILAEQIAIWFLFGVSYWLVFPPQGGYLPQIIGAFSLSWVAGYVAFFAPGGIGIREVLLAILLGAFFKSSEVAVYAAIHRLVWVAAEVILGAGSATLFGLPSAPEKPSEEKPT